MFNSKAVAAATENISRFSIQYSSIALVVYDYILTFDLEVDHIWRSKFRWSTLAYIFTRYPLVANVLYLLAIANKLSNCDTWYKLIGALSVLGRASVITIFTLRAVAVYNQNKYVAAWLGTLGAICVALDITHVPGLKCTGSVAIPIVPTLLSILVVVFEFSTATLIALRAMQAFHARATLRASGLLPWVLKQGLLYFCAAFVLQLTAVVLNFVEANPDFKKLINAISLPLSCIFTARFMLQLRHMNDAQTLKRSATSMTTFQAASRGIRAALTQEFEDPVLTSYGAPSSRNQEMHSDSRLEDLEADLQDGGENAGDVEDSDATAETRRIDH